RRHTRCYRDWSSDVCSSDLDPIQAEILLLLADEVRGKLFIVGDPKQAIYRFRGTDVSTYWRVRDELADRGGRVLQLTTSYRSVRSEERRVGKEGRCGCGREG